MFQSKWIQCIGIVYIYIVFLFDKWHCMMLRGNRIGWRAKRCDVTVLTLLWQPLLVLSFSVWFWHVYIHWDWWLKDIWLSSSSIRGNNFCYITYSLRSHPTEQQGSGQWEFENYCHMMRKWVQFTQFISSQIINILKLWQSCDC